MIRVLLVQKLDDKSFAEGRKITLKEVADSTGIGRATLTRIANKPDYITTTEIIDKLCDYFDCEPGDLLKTVKR
ncbi:helix-turn-helix transcriptional regulator [Alteromonas sp. 14N.309.X.WAT.G.H12]|uniref:helix-turn-helix domain-containing protein n=1 Tax=Alteromonas sp. 14N.309.X.WAT.G.H12 TaxID=3120824 RepID=UPI002FD72566